MKKYLFNLKYIALVILISLGSCISNELPGIGDLEDFTAPTPFYNVTDISTSEFNCNEEELSANYDFFFQAGTNLAVNGTNYDWTITPSEDVILVNKELPILKQLRDAELAAIVVLENEVAKLNFKIPCETNSAKKAVLEAQLADFEAQLIAANNNLSDEIIANVANLDTQIANLPEATLQDRELILSFPSPGNYTVSLTVTDNLGKSNVTEKIITVNQAVPTIPVPEIGEPGFEDNSLFDGTGDGRDSWRSPSSSSWGGVFQINTDTNPVDAPNLPEGTQAAKFPADGSRVGYQEIEVTPGATYVLTYYTAFEENNYGELTVSIVKAGLNDLAEAKLDANIIADRTDNNIGRVDNVFKKHALTFEAGDNESVVILLTNSDVESRVDAFDIVVKQ